MMETKNSIQIPGPFRYSKTTDIPDITVKIPVHASINKLSCYYHAAVYGLIGLLFLISSAAMAYASLVTVNIEKPIFTFTIIIAIAFFSAHSFAVMATCIFDATRKGPVIELNMKGLSDHRIGAAIDWDSIQSVKEIGRRGRILGIRLTTKESIPHQRNRFRIGTDFAWKLPPNEDRISVTTLDVKTYIILHTITVLVRRHGGTADVTRWSG